jgi:diaminopimelate epimerase/carbamoyl-phosphate synthase large subunit
MRYSFVKMHGAGNDYIYFDGFNGKPVPRNPEAASVVLSRRSFSVGGDGLVLILPDPDADARMRIFNADGSEGKMCGNGIRCVGKYLWDYGICKKETLRIQTNSGIKTLKLNIDGNGKVKSAVVDMGKPEFDPVKIPVIAENAFGVTVNAGKYGKLRVDCVSMGNPHAVCVTDSVDKIELDKIGPLVEHSDLFPERVNVEFIEVLGKHSLKFRVWERGSGETLACGTGICASVAVACEKGLCPKDESISVHAKGGCLDINYKSDGHIYMTGPAEISFTGEVEIND